MLPVLCEAFMPQLYLLLHSSHASNSSPDSSSKSCSQLSHIVLVLFHILCLHLLHCFSPDRPAPPLAPFSLWFCACLSWIRWLTPSGSFPQLSQAELNVLFWAVFPSVSVTTFRSTLLFAWYDGGTALWAHWIVGGSSFLVLFTDLHSWAIHHPSPLLRKRVERL